MKIDFLYKIGVTLQKWLQKGLLIYHRFSPRFSSRAKDDFKKSMLTKPAYVAIHLEILHRLRRVTSASGNSNPAIYAYVRPFVSVTRSSLITIKCSVSL